MKKLLDRQNLLAGILGAAVLAIPFSAAHAQGAPQNGWFKVCSTQGETEVCNVQYQAIAGNGQVVTSINLAELKGKVNRKIFQVTVPTGRLIPAGIKLRVDEKKETIIPYIFCFQDRCAAEVKLDDTLVKLLKSGTDLHVTSVNFQQQENPIKITLSGFTQAYDGPPIKPDALADRQKKLAEELQKKAEEERKKLQEAQDAAKKQ